MTTNSLAVYNADTRREIIELMGFKGTDAHINLLFQLAEHYVLDVKLKEITLIPGKGPFIGVWGRIHIAQRSGMLDGFEADDEWHTENVYHVRCIVWRKDQSHPAAKVIGRVRDSEKKDWPWEIARARAVRAAFGYAFNIHDTYDDTDDWVPAPDEHLPPTAVIPQTEQEETPKRVRRANKKTGEVINVPPDPPTINVGGHTLAQRIAIAARNAGIDDDQTRHDIIGAASRGTYGRGTEIPEENYDPDLVDRIFEAFDGLRTGTVEYRGGQLFRVNR